MKPLRLFFAILFPLVLNACAAVNSTLKAPPIENSSFAEGVLHEEGQSIAPLSLAPFHRAWSAKSDCALADLRSVYYVSPVDTSRFRETEIWSARADRRDAESLGAYLRRQVEEALRRNGHEVTTVRPDDGLIVELALVEVSPTDVPRNVLGTALGAVIPGGGLLAFRSSGSIAVEGVVRDAKTHRAVFVFADRERGKTAPFSFNDFTPFSHARAAIDDWAEQLAATLGKPSGNEISDSYALTLFPL